MKTKIETKYQNYLFFAGLMVLMILLTIFVEFTQLGLPYLWIWKFAIGYTFVIPLFLIFVISFLIGKFKLIKEKIIIVSFYIYLLTLLARIGSFLT